MCVECDGQVPTGEGLLSGRCWSVLSAALSWKLLDSSRFRRSLLLKLRKIGASNESRLFGFANSRGRKVDLQCIEARGVDFDVIDLRHESFEFSDQERWQSYDVVLDRCVSQSAAWRHCKSSILGGFVV